MFLYVNSKIYLMTNYSWCCKLIFVRGPIIGDALPDHGQPQERVPKWRRGFATSARVPTSTASGARIDLVPVSARIVDRGNTEGRPRHEARSSGGDWWVKDPLSPRTSGTRDEPRIGGRSGESGDSSRSRRSPVEGWSAGSCSEITLNDRDFWQIL